MHCCRCRLFAVSGGRLLCIVLSSCRERTPGVPRKKNMGECRSDSRRRNIKLTNQFCAVKIFQPMRCTSVERTFCNLLFVYGRGRRSSSRTAYRLRLRSSPRTLSPSFLLSEKSHAASLLLACKRARDAPTCYQLFSVSGDVVLCLFSCCSAVENAGE